MVTINFNIILTSYRECKQKLVSLLQADGSLLKWPTVLYLLNSTEKTEFFFSDKDQN